MQIFRVVAGYSLGRADIVRRAISKKKLSVLESERASFLSGAAERGIAESAAADLFEEIVGFANYAFNKSHAAAYGVLSYRTAYLKAHYPREYNSALLTSVLGSADKMAEYIAECARVGIKILPPHVNESDRDFHVDGKNIRFGLLALKNLGRPFVESLLAERKRGGKFASFDDFMHRMGDTISNKRQLEMLIKSGALDGLGAKRSQLLTVYETVLDARSAANRQSVAGQLDLFSTPAAVEDGPAIPAISLPDIPEYSARELLALEKDSSGLYFSGHILDDYSRHVEQIQPDSIASIKASFASDEMEEEVPAGGGKQYADKQSVKIAGIIARRQNKATRGGEQMAFLTVEDRTGEIEVIVFAKSLETFGASLLLNEAVVISGTISLREEEDPKILLRSAKLLSDNASFVPPKSSAPAASTPQDSKKSPAKLFLKVDSMDSELYKRAESFIGIFPGTFPVVFYDASAGKYFRADGYGVELNDFVLRELRCILGDDAVICR